jgi:hypothetical protein
MFFWGGIAWWLMIIMLWELLMFLLPELLASLESLNHFKSLIWIILHV